MLEKNGLAFSYLMFCSMMYLQFTGDLELILDVRDVFYSFKELV